MKKILTTSVCTLSKLFILLDQYGVNIATFLTEAGIDPNISNQAEGRIPFEKVGALHQLASQILNDPFIGLHQGEIPAQCSSILSYLVFNCHNLSEALGKFIQYQKILDEGQSVTFEKRDGQVVLRLEMVDKSHLYNRHLAEFALMCMVTFGRLLTGKNDFSSREVHFTHADPGDTNEYERLFHCAPRFNSEMNALVFDERSLDLPILQPNRDLMVTLEQHAREALEHLEAGNSLEIRARRILVDALRGENPTIGMLASRLNMSVRNLQLKLKGEGTSFSKLLAEERKTLAQAYLKNHSISIGEISFLLGFAEPSIFHRTFKRWTGVAPGVFRRQEGCERSQ